jgi:long-chain acyl-CoA synthetase
MRWCILDFACQVLGLVSIGIYPQQSVEQVKYIIEHSDSKIIFVQKESELKTILEASKNNQNLKAIIPFFEKEYEKYKLNVKILNSILGICEIIFFI